MRRLPTCGHGDGQHAIDGMPSISSTAVVQCIPHFSHACCTDGAHLLPLNMIQAKASGGMQPPYVVRAA
eukprot:365866-Chlamydomonas_euryale.AAC.8